MRAIILALSIISSVAQALTLTAGAAEAATPTPAGTWRTFDDKTGKERSLVRIDEQAGVFAGRVLSTVDPRDADRVCDKCDGDRHGKPIIGLEIIRGMRQDGNEWDGGRVLDPETGSVYHGSMRLEDGGQKLVLRGYIGISLFGRSQTWLRAAP